jgi:hypothetical protein
VNRAQLAHMLRGGDEWEADMDVASLADLLHETAEHHGSFEAAAPPRDWWDWYAAYMDARQRGSTPVEAIPPVPAVTP